MGLDMYCYRVPNTHKIKDYVAVEDYVSWQKHLKEQNLTKEECSFKEWCGIENEPSLELVNELKPLITTKYSVWDTEHNYPHDYILEQVAYWRKANEIHNWIVDNIQEGEDDCGEYVFPRHKIVELLDICKEVLKNSELVCGKVIASYSFDKDMNKVINWQDGKVIKDSSVAEELLPTRSGFFFGSTSYDEYYIEDIESTIKQLTKILEETDFNKEDIYYSSSW